jgi:hypothetical protein
MRYRDLVEDGHVPGLLVHPDWWEPKHPQEIPVTVDDPVALYRPAPEISIPNDYGNPEAPTPIPSGPSGPATTSLAIDPVAGATQFVTDTAVTYKIGQFVAISFIGGGHFVSRITTTTDSPTFVIPFTTAFAGTPVSGGNVWIFDS